MKALDQGGKATAILIVLLVILAGGYFYWSALRPFPASKAVEPTTRAQVAVPAGKPLSWPGQGQSAVGLVGSTLLETHGAQTPLPTASTAKLITALCVLQKKPLTLGQQGPSITLTAKDVAIFNNYFAKDGSLVKVQVGEKLSEYQMLQAMLLPSANNIADSLANWAFGSLSIYSAYANGYVAAQGLTATRVGSDASGFDPSTVSSAHDMVKIGENVMKNPVLTQIVGQPGVNNFPIAGNIKNVNFLLGADNIVGIKTGNNDQDGGAFVSASRVKVSGKSVTIVTALMGSSNIYKALSDSRLLVRSAQSNFKPARIISAGTVMGRYKLPWGGSVSAASGQDLSLSGWAGGNIPYTVRMKPLPPNAKAGQTVGALTVSKSATNNQVSIPIKLKDTPTRPSIGWRLLHPF